LSQGTIIALNFITSLNPRMNLFEISIVCSTKQTGQLIAGLFSFPLREASVLNPRRSAAPPWGTGERIPPKPPSVGLSASETVFPPNRRKPIGDQPLSSGFHLAPRPDLGPCRNGISLLRAYGANALAPLWRKGWFQILNNEG
jgi:hypothetical protein